MRHLMPWIIAVMLSLCLVLLGCGKAKSPTATPTPSPTATSIPTDTPAPTDTPRPTATPTPTETPLPTPSPLPTATPSPAPTPVPSATPTPSPTPTPVDTPTPTLNLIAIGTLTDENIGEEVSIQGEVIAAASFSKGFTFTLDDGTGQIVLLMWHNVYDDCWDAPIINVGAEVQVTGEVSQYEETLQIEPSFGGDVKAFKEATATASMREIGSLSGSDEGSRVMIEGEVLRVEGLSSAVKVSLGDKTGEIVVFIWRNVLDRIADNIGLGTEGSRVRVVGTVEIYRSNLQVAPTLPNDVTVLEIP